MEFYLVLAFIAGTGFWYVVFYMRYKQKDVVKELRHNLKEANREILTMTQELDEHMQQNIILKSKMTDFLDKNDDLSKVVWELSKYYYHIKEASKKTDELSKFLQEPDIIIEEKMKVYMQNNTHDNYTNYINNDKDNQNKIEKTMKDFF